MLFDDPCDNITGPVADICKPGEGGTGTTLPGGVVAPIDPVGGDLDPLTALAKSTAKAAHWTSQQLGAIVGNRDSVDLTNKSFLQQYAIVFAASTILVLVLWLFAVAKRAIRGVPMTTAMSEAVGLLWIAVAASAFTPLVLYTIIGAASAVTDVLVTALGSNPNGLFDSLGADLEAGKIGGGPLVLFFVSLATIALCGALWLLLVIRALALYVGALFSVVIYAGLVDRDWWGHTRKWAGVMFALIAVEPVIVIVIGLAAALETGPDNSKVTTGLGITVVALGAAVFLMFKIPGVGDAVKVARTAGRVASGATRAVAGPGSASAATGVMRGISAHGERGSGAGRSSSIGTQKSPNNVSGGIAAHSDRKPKPKGK
ncbi:hypothetical protein [Streptomyces sp. AP-93]|uniref:hypothetical protein n=1 Tax=Streptomyces sp. AP-93 TaxID=2929048 RepID=UPI001FAF0C25|nr:hypothetical protein [Streptomyces sp. AP-93]MCJ0875235.1 hypothetical protein [Streptomyces sp. AP-93]